MLEKKNRCYKPIYIRQFQFANQLNIFFFYRATSKRGLKPFFGYYGGRMINLSCRLQNRDLYENIDGD